MLIVSAAATSCLRPVASARDTVSSADDVLISIGDDEPITDRRILDKFVEQLSHLGYI